MKSMTQKHVISRFMQPWKWLVKQIGRQLKVLISSCIWLTSISNSLMYFLQHWVVISYENTKVMWNRFSFRVSSWNSSMFFFALALHWHDLIVVRLIFCTWSLIKKCIRLDPMKNQWWLIHIDCIQNWCFFVFVSKVNFSVDHVRVRV